MHAEERGGLVNYSDVTHAHSEDRTIFKARWAEKKTNENKSSAHAVHLEEEWTEDMMTTIVVGGGGGGGGGGVCVCVWGGGG
jgi:hypothetical protein